MLYYPIIESESYVIYSQVWWPILGIRALPLSIQVHTHSSEHTHTHPEQWAAIYAVAPREPLGVRCLSQGHLVVVLRVEGALYIHSPHQQSLPDRDLNSQHFDYESDSLPLGHDSTIGPQTQLLVFYVWVFVLLCLGREWSRAEHSVWGKISQ